MSSRKIIVKKCPGPIGPNKILFDIFDDSSSVALWGLDNNGDDVGTNYSLSQINSLTYSGGYIGNAVSGFSTSNYLTDNGNFASAFKLSNYSVSLWIKLTTMPDGASVVFSNYTRSYGSGSSYNSGGMLYFGSVGGEPGHLKSEYEVKYKEDYTDSNGNNNNTYGIQAALSKQLSLNKWYHVVKIQEPTSTSLYVNGQFEVSVSSSQTIQYSTYYNTLSVGILEYTNTGNHFPFEDGQIDHIRFFNRVITPEEIQLLYQERCY